MIAKLTHDHETHMINLVTLKLSEMIDHITKLQSYMIDHFTVISNHVQDLGLDLDLDELINLDLDLVPNLILY